MSDEPARHREDGPDGVVLARAEGRVDRPAPAAFLRRFAGLPRGFWERDGRWCAWAGSSARLEVARGADAPFAEMRARADGLFDRLAAPGTGREGGAAPPRLYGGFAFDPGRRPDPGMGSAPPGDLPGGLFVLPAVELRADGEPADEDRARAPADPGGPADAAGPARLAVTVAAPAGTPRQEVGAAARRALDRVRAALQGLDAAGAGDGRNDASPAVREVRRRPERRGWDRLVEAALEAVAAGRQEKVVAARCLELTLERPADAAAVLEALRGGGEGTFPYLLEPVGGTFVAGAAPEIVAAREGRRFRATAVAGTVRDGGDAEESERRARRLLTSDKDRREHRIGVRDMREALLEVAGVADVDEAPAVLRLQGMQHLFTRIGARVPADLHVLELLAALHPTAAVNGRPRDAALAFLRDREPLDRGWYAGPVGWLDAAGDGAFAPALRSVEARGGRARVCAGAGIVEGSRPGAEWDETAVKLRPALRAMGLSGGAADRAAGVGDGDEVPAGREIASAGESGG